MRFRLAGTRSSHESTPMSMKVAAAQIGAPHEELMSTPAWNRWVPKMGWVRHPYPEVIEPGAGQ